MSASFKKQTYSTAVADYIRKQIRVGSLLPGQAIKEVALAEKLGISRAPIREALESLVQEGLVTSEPQKGKRVRLMTPQEVECSYRVGGILEATGVRDSLPLWQDAELRELEHILKGMYAKSLEVHDLAGLTELDDTFHDMLLMHCDNPYLTDLARRSCSTISKYLMYRQWSSFYTPKEFYERHQLIVDAMLARDPERIWRVIRRHYDELGEKMAGKMTAAVQECAP